MSPVFGLVRLREHAADFMAVGHQPPQALDRVGLDSGVIQIMLIETSTQYLIDTARIRSRGGLLTFHDNKPADLIGPPLAKYARSLIGLSDQ